MLNQVVLVGRLTKDVEVMENESGKKKCYVNLAVPRPYKNQEGLYETDFINCTLWNVIAQNTKDYCHSGDLVGIKGRLQSSSYEAEDKTTIYKTEVVVEKISFLSSKKDLDK